MHYSYTFRMMTVAAIIIGSLFAVFPIMVDAHEHHSSGVKAGNHFSPPHHHTRSTQFQDNEASGLNSIPSGFFRRGSRGQNVQRIQQLLIDRGFNPGSPDGIFGSGTQNALQQFQRQQGLSPDGVVGPNTWKQLLGGQQQQDRPTFAPGAPADYSIPAGFLRRGSRGDSVKRLQELLNTLGCNAGSADGVFGGGTRAALIACQTGSGITADGIAGPKTWQALLSRTGQNASQQQSQLGSTESSFTLPGAGDRAVEIDTANVTISTDDMYRYIISNGIPDHVTGQFPNSGNPNTISTQSHQFRVPLNPVKTSIATPIQMTGVALNGVFFEPGTAEAWNNDRSSGWNLEALQDYRDLGLDDNNAHVQPTGAYHYHGVPTGIVGAQNGAAHSELVGYAADGFPIYVRYGYEEAMNPITQIENLQPSWQLKSGTRPSGPGGTYDGTYTQDFEYVAGSGDLDECNGRTTVTPEYPNGTYAYFITDAFPYISRCVMGTPDSSFVRRGGGPQPGGGF